MKDDLRQGADKVCAVLREAGHQAYLAGGCVRDELLGLRPKDYDIVTDARPDEVARLFRRTLLVGAAFGVVKVLWSGGRDYEVATFRTEGAYSDGRRPDEVVYSDDWREDVARRDLTINALLKDPVTDEVLDAVGGRDDLAVGLVRAVGEPARRFQEDKLRMLRAVRFSARFRFRLEDETARAIQAHASGLSSVSKERIVAELEGIFRGHPGLGFSMMQRLGLIEPALPHVAADLRPPLIARMQRLEQIVPPEASERYAIGWAVTLEGLAGKAAEQALRALKLSREMIRGALRLHGARGALDSDAPSTSAAIMRLAAADDAGRLAAFQRVLLGDDHPAVARFAAARRDLEVRPLPARPAIGGEDLKALGVRPGRAFKEILTAVDDAVLERRVTSRDEALALAQHLAHGG